MSSPSKGDVHVNTPLTNISIAYMQDATRFVASRVFPNIPVSKESDRYYVYDRGEFNRDDMQKRAPGTQSAGGSYKLTNTPNYFCETYAFHHDIPDQIRGNSDPQVNHDRDATNLCTTKALIKRESLWAGKYFQAGVWATDSTPAILWDAANATPITDVRDAKRSMLRDTGEEGNTMVLGKKVFDVLADSADFLDRVNRGQTPGQPAQSTLNIMAQLFEVDRIFVLTAIKNIEPEKAIDFAFPPAAGYEDNVFIGDETSCLLCYAAPSPGMMIPTAGYTFSWTGFLGAGVEGNRIKRFRMEPESSDRVEIELAIDQKLVCADLGFFFESVVAADA